ncbi:MAG: hypothetical protein ACLFSI_01310 [Halorhodospira sp.]
MAGDEARATDCLEERLGRELDWSEAVQNGVTLLAWMVAHGHLTVKVAVRVHGNTGDPYPLAYRGDGYVHEKWALFQDAHGDGLLASGSLNESRTALEINAENLDLSPSWIEWVRNRFEKRRQSFEAMWAGNHPQIRTFDLPEAVCRRLVRLADRASLLREIDGTPGLTLTQVSEPPAPRLSWEERLRFALLRVGPLATRRRVRRSRDRTDHAMAPPTLRHAARNRQLPRVSPALR